MELVEGPTLADRIGQGPIPVGEALFIGRQIAEALEAAHEQGIIHRDLKPANIKVRTDGTVKVLDFGLAKGLDPTSAGTADVTASPTITSPVVMTGVGVILGTAAYMSPEQARGKAVDRRTDVWAFGCVLFEMITGRIVFPGATVSDTIAAVLERSPDWTALPPATPPAVRHVLARCLEKDPKRRWRDVGDVRIELDDAKAWQPQTDGASSKTSRAGERAAWALLVALAALVAAVVTPMFRKAPAPAEIRFNLLFPRGVAADFAQLAISPDGQQIVVAPGFGVQQPSPLWLRPLASTSGRLLTGTEGASFPFWSPDGRSIGFFADQKLKRLDVNSQAIQILAEAPNARGGAWQADGTILFAPNATVRCFGCRQRGPANRRHTTRERAERSSSAVHPSGREALPLLRQRDAASPRGTRGSPRWHRDEAAARRGRCRGVCPIGSSSVSAAGGAAGAGVRCQAAALEGEAFRVAGQRLRQSRDQPCLAVGVSSRTDCVRHGQHPSNAVRLVRSFWPAARNSWHTGSKRPGQSFAVARRQSDRFQPRRRWELGHLADRHARRGQQIHVGSRPSTSIQSGHRTAGRSSTNRTIQTSTHDR